MTLNAVSLLSHDGAPKQSNVDLETPTDAVPYT
jgi:hypothetical protein